ncbi:hypothetical protein VSR01_30935 [Actinacidiphila sp. DG2A-62]|uniref:hypothetical protein n=1 Tax=Actinacidiphila sp. DG2A-62 TaxID=3108821 RepID=UPI002DB9CE23|nr:hypothetical protein [Actinacidiphila sp. DG2A-62]MEC3997670.1 hypothetical protein [Actinacidiphila sp. DG2A-62]
MTASARTTAEPAVPDGAASGAGPHGDTPARTPAGLPTAAVEPGLDRPVRLIGGRLSLAALALVLTVGAGTAWGVAGSLPHTLVLHGVLAHGPAPVTVRAAAPGSVLRVLVAPGARVAAGQPVAVLADSRSGQDDPPDPTSPGDTTARSARTARNGLGTEADAHRPATLGTSATSDTPGTSATPDTSAGGTELTAPEAGIVTAVLTAPGGTVVPGSAVIALDPSAAPATVRLFTGDAGSLRRLRTDQRVLVGLPDGRTVRLRITGSDPYPATADSLRGSLPVPVPGVPAGTAPVWTVRTAPDRPQDAAALSGVLPTAVDASVDLGARHPYQVLFGSTGGAS